MCGRGRQAAPPAYYRDLAVRDAGVPSQQPWKHAERFKPTQNLAPGHYAVVVVAGSLPYLCTKVWGLVPDFGKKSQAPDFWRMFNARAEGLSTSPVFRRLLKDRRCAVPLDGFFEWTADEMPKVASSGTGGKQPWYVHLKADDGPLWVAGLHESSSDGELETFTLITRDVDSNLAWLHDRMPVILNAAGLAAWLSPTAEPPLEALATLRLPSDSLSWHPTTKVPFLTEALLCSLCSPHELTTFLHAVVHCPDLARLFPDCLCQRMTKLDYQEADVSSPAKLPSQQQKSVASFFAKPKRHSPADPVAVAGPSDSSIASSSSTSSTAFSIPTRTQPPSAAVERPSASHPTIDALKPMIPRRPEVETEPANSKPEIKIEADEVGGCSSGSGPDTGATGTAWAAAVSVGVAKDSAKLDDSSLWECGACTYRHEGAEAAPGEIFK